MLVWSDILPLLTSPRLATAINVGILLGFFVGFVFEGLPEDKNWRLMILMGSLMPFIILIVISKRIMPESPRWLMQRDRREEVRSGEELKTELRRYINTSSANPVNTTFLATRFARLVRSSHSLVAFARCRRWRYFPTCTRGWRTRRRS